MGLLHWVRGKVSSMVQAVQSAYTDTVATVQSACTDTLITLRNVREFMQVPEVRVNVSNTLLHFWQGLSRALDPTILVTLLLYTRPKTLWTMIHAQSLAVKRLVRALAFHMYVKPVIGKAVRAVTYDSAVAEFIVVNAIDLAAAIYFTRKAVSALLVDNVASGLALSKTSALESAEKEPANHALMQPCGHGSVSNFTASTASMLNYYVNWLVLTILGRAIPGGKYLLLPDALFNGRTYLEYPLAAAGNCTEDRLKVLNANNAYAAGFGFSSAALFLVLREIIARYTGVRDSIFVDEAIAASVAFYFIILANCSRNLKLPGDKPGIDYFAPTRKLVDTGSLLLQKRFTQTYMGKSNVDWVKSTHANLQGHWNSIPGRVLRKLLLEESLQDVNKLAERRSVRHYLEESKAKEDITGYIKTVIDMRNDWFLNLINKGKKLFPKVNGEERKLLSLGLDKHLRTPLAVAHHFFTNLYKEQKCLVEQPAEEGTYATLLATPASDTLPLRLSSKVEVVPSQEMTRPEMARPPAPTEAPAAIKQEEENDDESSYASLLVPIVNPQPALNSHNRSNPSITRGGKNL